MCLLPALSCIPRIPNISLDTSLSRNRGAYLPLPRKGLVEKGGLNGKNEPVDMEAFTATLHDGIGELGIVEEADVIADPVSVTSV